MTLIAIVLALAAGAALWTLAEYLLHRFAMHALTQTETMRDEHGRGRHTLWTGDLGVALYLRACLDVDDRWPLLDVL